MPIPKRSRTKSGRWRKKRSDAGKPRGQYKKGVILEVSEEEVKEQYDSIRVDVSKITTIDDKETRD